MLGGQRVRIAVREPAQEDLNTKTETEAQAKGPTEAQQQEQPLRRSTHARPSLGLVRRVSLPPLLALLQLEALQLLVRH